MNDPSDGGSGFMNHHNGSTRRLLDGRLFFYLAVLLLAAAIVVALDNGAVVWSRAQRSGGINDLIVLRDGIAAARLYRNEISVCRRGKVITHAYPNPIQLEPDGRGGAFILGLFARQIGRLSPEGRLGIPTSFPHKYVLTAVLAEEDGVWVIGHNKHRIADKDKDVFYMPEYSRYEWMVYYFEKELPRSLLLVRPAPWKYDNEVWHEESAGIWRVLATQHHLYVINDQAESIHCLDRKVGRILWRAATSPRPTGALLWGDRLVLASAQGGVVEAFRLDNGGRIWRTQTGAGPVDIAWFEGRIVVADRVHDRLLALDPLDGGIALERRLTGAPHALAADGMTLLVGLDSTAQIVRLDASLDERERIDLADGVSP